MAKALGEENLLIMEARGMADREAYCMSPRILQVLFTETLTEYGLIYTLSVGVQVTYKDNNNNIRMNETGS